uniref:Clathrin light chain n=1 Tax=Caenorhabditis tropicalis TaxID=1561998 RepID=A0A1I7TKB6_9PELO
MDTFEFDSDAFYICTEISPRNFVVQKAIQIDKNQIERMVGKLDGKTEKAPSPDSSAGTSSAHSPGTSSSTSVSGVGGFPQPPPFPYW